MEPVGVGRRRAVVVRRHVEAEESAAGLHVPLETLELRGRLRLVVEEHDDLVLRRGDRGQLVPVGRGRVRETVLRGTLREPDVGLLLETDVCRIERAAVERQDLERRCGVRGGRGAEGEQKTRCEESH